MENVNFIAINLNPCSPSNYSVRYKKAAVRKIADFYKQNVDPEAILHGGAMYSFKPKHKTYTPFVKEFLDFYFEKNKTPLVVIFQSLFDISSQPQSAYNQLRGIIAKPYIKAVYFTNYSLDQDVSVYMDNLRDAFYLKENTHPQPNRIYKYPPEFIDHICKLRNEYDPVLISEIAEVSGLTEGTIKNICNRRGLNKYGIRGKLGRKLSTDEREKLSEMKKRLQNTILNIVEIHYESLKDTE